MNTAEWITEYIQTHEHLRDLVNITVAVFLAEPSLPESVAAAAVALVVQGYHTGHEGVPAPVLPPGSWSVVFRALRGLP